MHCPYLAVLCNFSFMRAPYILIVVGMLLPTIARAKKSCRGTAKRSRATIGQRFTEGAVVAENLDALIYSKIERLTDCLARSGEAQTEVHFGSMQTFRSAITVSALPPKADMCGALTDVRSGPIADINGSRPHSEPPQSSHVIGREDQTIASCIAQEFVDRGSRLK